MHVRPTLSDSTVDVWQIGLDADLPDERELFQLLDAAERQRSMRYASSVDRRRYTAAHAALRQILAGYLGLAPAQLRFRRDPAGKPHVLSERGHVISFNLTHSGAHALCAVTASHEVGIDIERIKPEISPEEIAPVIFSQRERAALAQEPACSRAALFFQLWTRKEALIKASGTGLYCAPTQIEADLRPYAPLALRRATGICAPQSCWAVCDLAVVGPYAAAVAASGSSWEVRQLAWRWGEPARPTPHLQLTAMGLPSA